MHPAHIGMMALPYYDTFDLSTVDVLLISQYVSRFLLAINHMVFGGQGRRIAAVGHSDTGHCAPHHVYENQWNIFTSYCSTR